MLNDRGDGIASGERVLADYGEEGGAVGIPRNNRAPGAGAGDRRSNRVPDVSRHRAPAPAP